MRGLNERQARAVAAIMAQIAMLPWTERADVFAAVECNDDICVHCGQATERFGCPRQNDE